MHGPAAEDTTNLETFLIAAHDADAHPDELNVCPNAALAQTFLGNIRQLQPKWNVVQYHQEMAFYVQEHKRCQQPAATAAP
ncbi:hypothetical protein SAMN00120144_2265 [Hymenobacter roseosalivarius DSM 11622]|uniref:Uncharacterized protein n=1 Tax=Hymenobacter roseosalivarius DSM 11622 TaxID=645990 RepID=A0A1W1VWZ1_9BACT|nr:hypothetical protein [Hymenobacter roseosalivarius]SMB97899.1 hypothetical protein SAMN00120144_2265 [Hymenobacter roseosalivarius DSM 11622]